MNVIKKEWDTDFFKIDVGYVNLGRNELIKENDFDLVYVFSEYSLEDYTEYEIDVKLIFENDLSKNIGPKIKIETGISISDYVDSEVNYELIKNLAISSGLFSRFKKDKRIGLKKFEELYELWIQKNISSDEDDILVVIKESLIIGFVSISYDSIKRIAIIDLIAISEKHRGQGIGRFLLSTLKEKCMEKDIIKIRVATQEQNVGAIALYEKSGFELVNRTFVYHLWRK